MARAVHTIPVLGEDDVRAAVSHQVAIEVIQQVYRDYGRHGSLVSAPPALTLKGLESDAAAFKIKGGHVPGAAVAGFRIIADREQDGVEQTRDLCWVADAASGAVLGVVEEAWLHRLRTAVTGLVAAKWSARANVQRVALIGTGLIAAEVPPALPLLFADLAELRVFSRRSENVEAFAARHGTQCPTRAARSIEEATDGADIVILLTAASAPILHACHLAKGITVCGLGGGAEIDAGVLDVVNRFIVDEFGYATMIGSVHGWIEAGRSVDELRCRVSADIGEVATGRKPGRAGEDEIVLNIIQGMACCDVALAHVALQRTLANSA